MSKRVLVSVLVAAFALAGLFTGAYAALRWRMGIRLPKPPDSVSRPPHSDAESTTHHPTYARATAATGQTLVEQLKNMQARLSPHIGDWSRVSPLIAAWDSRALKERYPQARSRYEGGYITVSEPKDSVEAAPESERARVTALLEIDDILQVTLSSKTYEEEYRALTEAMLSATAPDEFSLMAAARVRLLILLTTSEKPEQHSTWLARLLINDRDPVARGIAAWLTSFNRDSEAEVGQWLTREGDTQALQVGLRLLSRAKWETLNKDDPDSSYNDLVPLGGRHICAPIVALARHPDPTIRVEAVRALGPRHFQPEAIEALIIAAKQDPIEEVRAAALRELQLAKHSAVAEQVLIDASGAPDGSFTEREAATRSLGSYRSTRVAEHLASIFARSDGRMRVAAAVSLLHTADQLTSQTRQRLLKLEEEIDDKKLRQLFKVALFNARDSDDDDDD